MMDPQKLWNASIQTLGQVAHMYGPPSPVPPHRFVSASDLAPRGIRVEEAPGHASHHVVFIHGKTLFVGEAAGIRVPLDSQRPYLRPSTPRPFHLNAALETLDRLIALAPSLCSICFAHYGKSSDPRTWCERARTQLGWWFDSAARFRQQFPSKADLEPLLFDWLMETDPLFGQGAFDELPTDLKQREKRFFADFCRQIPQLF